MKIKLILVGKTKEKWLQNGENEYEKRLSHYTKLEKIIIPEEKVGEDQKQINRECEKIISRLSDNDFVILLDLDGKTQTSKQFSDFLIQNETKKLVFIIGGALGVSDSLRKRANHRLKFSDLTFTHQMLRVFLIEQIYRAFTIKNGKNYHK